MRVLAVGLTVVLLVGSLFAMGVIDTFSTLQAVPQQERELPQGAQEPAEPDPQEAEAIEGYFIVQIGAFNNDRGAALLKKKNRERFIDKQIEIHHFPDEYGPYRVWLHAFNSYKSARKYIEHHAINGFIVEIRGDEHVRTEL